MSQAQQSKSVLLLTGSNGFIGSNLIRFLKKSGDSFEIRAISRTPVKLVASWISFDDFMAGQRPPDFFSGVTHFVHLAGVAHLKQQANTPELLQQSIDYFKAILSALPNSKLKKIILMSSYSVTFLERKMFFENRAYAENKLKTESIILDASKNVFSGCDINILRPPLVYGLDAPGNFSKLIKILKLPLILPLASINTQRASIHVLNLCSAIEHILVSPQKTGAKIFELRDPWEENLNTFLSDLNLAIDGRAKLIRFPPKLLELILSIFGMSGFLRKLATEIIINQADFESSVSWVGPIKYHDRFSGLRKP